MKLLYVLCAALGFCYAAAQEPPYVKKFSLNEILALNTGDTWKEFLNTSTMRAGVYNFKSNAQDAVKTAAEDGAYYIIKGKATLNAGGENHTALAGNIFYIKGGSAYNFSAIESDLVVLVIYSKATPPADEKPFDTYNMADIEQKRVPGENAWEPFIRSKTMTYGLYMLPQKTGGDSTLTHKMEELNYVTAGTSKFTVDDYTMDVTGGDIMYVDKGHGHYFHDLKSDFDVLIFWEKKSLQQ